MEEALQKDTDSLYEHLQQLCLELGITEWLDDSDRMDVADSSESRDGAAALLSKLNAQEIVRYGACELHNISAIIGGVAAQEAVKIITHQYVPINNTFIYNGISSTGVVYSL